MPDPRGQGEGDEGGEEGAPAGAVRKEHTCSKESIINSRNLFQKSRLWQFTRTVDLRTFGRQGNLKAAELHVSAIR